MNRARKNANSNYMRGATDELPPSRQEYERKASMQRRALKSRAEEISRQAAPIAVAVLRRSLKALPALKERLRKEETVLFGTARESVLQRQLAGIPALVENYIAKSSDDGNRRPACLLPPFDGNLKGY